MDNSVLEHTKEKRQGSYWRLELVLSGALLRESLSTILPFFANDPLPDLPNFPEMEKSGWDHATEKRKGLYWSLETVLSGPLHMNLYQRFYQATEKNKVHIEANNLYFQVRNFGDLYQRF